MLLNLQGNNLSSINFLENRNSLQFLNIMENQISDLQPLETCTELNELFMKGN